MLWESSAVAGFGIEASDGATGSISDLLFDDTNWALRWCVVETGSWLSDRKSCHRHPRWGRRIPFAGHFR